MVSHYRKSSDWKGAPSSVATAAGVAPNAASRMKFKAPSRFVWLLLSGAVAFLLPTSAHANIRIVSTGERFSSHLEDGLGMSFWKGYEYEGRLQYIETNLHLCESTYTPSTLVPCALLFYYLLRVVPMVLGKLV